MFLFMRTWPLLSITPGGGVELMMSMNPSIYFALKKQGLKAFQQRLEKRRAGKVY
jgi:hypothetical protein